MFFSAYIGDDAGLALWRQAVIHHARWLDIAPNLESQRLADSRNSYFGWRNPTAYQECRGLMPDHEQTINSAGSTGDKRALFRNILCLTINNRSCNAITLQICSRSGEITIHIPPTTPQQVYFVRTKHGYCFSDDLRLFRHLIETELDDRAVYVLFQYGAIPPTLSIFKNVHRIPNGHVFRWNASLAEPVCTTSFHLNELERQEGDYTNSETRIQQELDRVLSAIPESAVLYFSGGVDSGLVLARLASLGRTDIQLINYAFSENDDESFLALQMASHFGFECDQIRHTPSKVADVLDRIAQDYSYPFGDCSTVPTNILVHASLPSAKQSRTVIEGTGADGAFGIGDRYRAWARVYAIPSIFRKQGNSAYSWLKLWKYNSNLERLGRVARKSSNMDLGSAVVAENALAGIAYPVPNGIRERLQEAIKINFGKMSTGSSSEDQLSLLDLVWVCAGRMAPKSFEPLRRYNIQAIYPFLELPLVRASLSLGWDHKCRAGEQKAILKTLLARSVPREWVYRSKSGFAPPHKELLASAPMQEFMRQVVLSRENQLLEFCRPDLVRDLVERAYKRHGFSPGACDFLWTLTFTSGWLNQLPRKNPHSGIVSGLSWTRNAA